VVHHDEFLSWQLYWRALFGLEALTEQDVIDPSGLVHSQALQSADGAFRVTINASDARETLSSRFLARGMAGGYQHVAMACDDLAASSAALRERGPSCSISRPITMRIWAPASASMMRRWPGWSKAICSMMRMRPATASISFTAGRSTGGSSSNLYSVMRAIPVMVRPMPGSGWRLRRVSARLSRWIERAWQGPRQNRFLN
jgi:hypothetical protein